MPGRTDRPGAPPPADGPGQDGAPDGSQDELRRRLASLPANHPSSPWYRERAARRERAGRPDPAGKDQGESRETRPDGAARARSREPAESGPSTVDRAHFEEFWVTGRERPATRREDARRGDKGQKGNGPEDNGPEGTGQEGKGQAETGEGAAIAARVARGAQARGPEKDSRRREDDPLWRLAASQHAASEARRQARRGGTPISPGGKRDPYRPWFADGTDHESWLSAEDTGEPWFTDGRER